MSREDVVFPLAVPQEDLKPLELKDILFIFLEFRVFCK